MKTKNFRILVATVVMAAAVPAAAQLPYQNPSLSSLERARDLCSRLTIEEKSQIMRNGSPAIERLGIPQFDWWSERTARHSPQRLCNGVSAKHGHGGVMG